MRLTTPTTGHGITGRRRFRPAGDQIPDAKTRNLLSVFELFDVAARAAVIRGHQEARSHGSDHIGTEHLLLGVLSRDRGSAVEETLKTFNVTPEEIRSRVEDAIGPASEPQSGHLPFSQHARLALNRTRALSEAGGHSQVGPPQVLAALMSDGQSAAAKTLMSLAIQPAAVCERVLDSAAGPGR